MRTLGRFLLLLSVAAGLYWVYPSLHFSGLIRQGSNAYKLELVKQATPAIAYEVSSKHWLDFHLDAGTSQIRIISSATVRDLEKIKSARVQNPTKRWKYALQIEVLDKNDRILLKQERHLRTDLALYKDAQGREYTPAFYLQEDRTPLTGMVIRLNFAGLASPDRLRLRLFNKDDDITDVVARVYIPKKVTERKVRYLWQRLSEKAKASMAVGSVYPTELLTEEEKRALMLNTWQPVGPEGHQGDYRRWDYYILQENEGEMIDNAIAPAGMPISPKLSGIVPLPEEGGKFRLHFEAMPGASAKHGNIQLKWYGETAFLRKQIKLQWKAQAQDAVISLGGGMLEILADNDLSARVFQISNKHEETEITPPPQYLRAYTSSPAHPVEYGIAHVGDAPTPIKVDFRYLTPAQDVEEERSPPVRYELLDAEGRSLKQGIIALSKPDTRYDNLVNDYSGAHLSDPSTYYFLLPANTARLRLTATSEDAPVVVSVHSRPLDLPHSYRAPEDQFDFDAQGKRISAWFTLKPENTTQLLSDNATILMTVQPRPPKDKPELLTGRYFWEDFHPLGDWKGRILLTPQESYIPYRSEALPGTYQIIMPGHESTVTVPSYESLRTLTPNLLWVRPLETPAEFRLFLDGHLHQQGRLAGRNGEINLLPMATGTHQLRLETDAGGKIFLNHLKPVTQAYVKRLANQMEGELRFEIRRDTLCEETISASLFQPGGSKTRSQLRVDVRGPSPASLTPMPAWVFPVRLFDVRPESHNAVTVFSTQSALTDIGQSFYIQLPEGAPRGLYRFSVRLQGGPGGYLLLSRLTPGIKPTRRVLHESDLITYETVQN